MKIIIRALIYLTNINYSDILIFRMNQLTTTVIIRDRGQLTIPDFIRRLTTWVSSGSAVSISKTSEDEIVIKPQAVSERKIDWDKLWRSVELSRSFKGTYHGSLSQFIAKDRSRH